MTVKIVTFWSTLMMYALEEAEAEKTNDPAWIQEAKDRHETYRQLCLQADEMILPPIFFPKEVGDDKKNERLHALWY